jgi:O-antigen/teichoic acid export membrane protein
VSAQPEGAALSTAPEHVPPWRRGAGILAISTIAIGLGNYAVALLMTRILSAHEFSRFASGQGLLLVLGTGSMAALPWAVSRYIASQEYDHSLPKALYFGLAGSLVQAVVLGSIAFGASWFIGGPDYGATIFAAVFLISLLAGPIGYFQGINDLEAIAAVRSLETIVRIAAGLAVVLTLWSSATGALLGFPVGSAAALAFALWRARSAFPLRRLERAVELALARQALLLGAIQVLLSMLAALDTVYVATANLSVSDGASYQSAAIFGRIPLFFSGALSVACYTALVQAHDNDSVRRVMADCVRSYSWLTAVFVAACVTVPGSLFHLVIPSGYAKAPELLRITCVLGAAIGLINVITTAHQARGRYGSSILILVAAVAAQALALPLAGRMGGVTYFALAGAVVGAGCLLGLGIDARRWLAVPRFRITWPAVASGALILTMIWAAPGWWLAAATALTLLCVWQSLLPAHRPFSRSQQRGPRGAGSR